MSADHTYALAGNSRSGVRSAVSPVPADTGSSDNANFVSLVTGNSALARGHERTEMEPDDSILWARSRVGDADAFALLFERHAKAIYN